MQQQLKCAVSLLLILGVAATTARRELPLVATDGDRGSGACGQGMAAADQSAGLSIGVGSKPEKAAKEEVKKRSKDERVVSSSCHFRTRKLPWDGKVHFDASMPFTADYHSVHRHPPKHN